jgi:hypothetical protein
MKLSFATRPLTFALALGCLSFAASRSHRQSLHRAKAASKSSRPRPEPRPNRNQRVFSTHSSSRRRSNGPDLDQDQRGTVHRLFICLQSYSAFHFTAALCGHRRSELRRRRRRRVPGNVESFSARSARTFRVNGLSVGHSARLRSARVASRGLQDGVDSNCRWTPREQPEVLTKLELNLMLSGEGHGARRAFHAGRVSGRLAVERCRALHSHGGAIEKAASSAAWGEPLIGILGGTFGWLAGTWSSPRSGHGGHAWPNRGTASICLVAGASRLSFRVNPTPSGIHSGADGNPEPRDSTIRTPPDAPAIRSSRAPEDPGRRHTGRLTHGFPKVASCGPRNARTTRHPNPSVSPHPALRIHPTTPPPRTSHAELTR